MATLYDPPTGVSIRVVEQWDPARDQDVTVLDATVPVLLRPRSRWDRLWRSPGLYRSYRRLGLTRVSAWQCVWVVLSFRPPLA